MEDSKNIAIKQIDKSARIFTLAHILSEFDANFLDERRCQISVLGLLYPKAPFKNPNCPGCGTDVAENLLRSFWQAKRIRCGKCGKYFTALTGTFLSGTHFNFREIVLLTFMLSLGIDDKQIAATLHISAESVRLWRLKFKSLEEANKNES